MNVAIGISSAELSRYAVFVDSVLHLRGVTAENVIHGKGSSVAANRNGITELAQARGFDAILYLDDDQVLAPDTLERLIAHDKDVVSGLYVRREVPFNPHVYLEREDQSTQKWDHLCLSPGTGGLVRCDMVGAGCLLVKMSVFEKLPKPYWTLGQGEHKDIWHDDDTFCRAVQAAGFDIWCDLEANVGHQFNGTLWPHRDAQGRWWTALMIGNNVVCQFPAFMPSAARSRLILPEPKLNGGR